MWSFDTGMLYEVLYYEYALLSRHITLEKSSVQINVKKQF